MIRSLIIGLFEANDTMGMGLARQLKALLEKFGLTSKVLCYVKDKGTNLSNMTTTLKSMIWCEALNLLQPFDGTCFGQQFKSFAIQANFNCEKYNKIDFLLSLYIIDKRTKEWRWTCIKFDLPKCKLTILVKTQLHQKLPCFNNAWPIKRQLSCVMVIR